MRWPETRDSITVATSTTTTTTTTSTAPAEIARGAVLSPPAAAYFAVADTKAREAKEIKDVHGQQREGGPRHGLHAYDVYDQVHDTDKGPRHDPLSMSQQASAPHHHAPTTTTTTATPTAASASASASTSPVQGPAIEQASVQADSAKRLLRNEQHNMLSADTGNRDSRDSRDGRDSRDRDGRDSRDGRDGREKTDMDPTKRESTVNIKDASNSAVNSRANSRANSAANTPKLADAPAPSSFAAAALAAGVDDRAPASQPGQGQGHGPPAPGPSPTLPRPFGVHNILNPSDPQQSRPLPRTRPGSANSPRNSPRMGLGRPLGPGPVQYPSQYAPYGGGSAGSTESSPLLGHAHPAAYAGPRRILTPKSPRRSSLGRSASGMGGPSGQPPVLSIPQSLLPQSMSAPNMAGAGGSSGGPPSYLPAHMGGPGGIKSSDTPPRAFSQPFYPGDGSRPGSRPHTPGPDSHVSLPPVPITREQQEHAQASSARYPPPSHQNLHHPDQHHQHHQRQHSQYSQHSQHPQQHHPQHSQHLQNLHQHQQQHGGYAPNPTPAHQGGRVLSTGGLGPAMGGQGQGQGPAQLQAPSHWGSQGGYLGHGQHQHQLSDGGGRTLSMSADGQQFITITPSVGEEIHVPIDIHQASKQADEKRLRNAGASARFRARKKEKDREVQVGIQRLEGMNRELQRRIQDLEVQRDFYRNDRNRLRHIMAQNPSMREYAESGPASPASTSFSVASFAADGSPMMSGPGGPLPPQQQQQRAHLHQPVQMPPHLQQGPPAHSQPPLLYPPMSTAPAQGGPPPSAGPPPGYPPSTQSPHAGPDSGLAGAPSEHERPARRRRTDSGPSGISEYYGGGGPSYTTSAPPPSITSTSTSTLPPLPPTTAGQHPPAFHSLSPSPLSGSPSNPRLPPLRLDTPGSSSVSMGSMGRGTPTPEPTPGVSSLPAPQPYHPATTTAPPNPPPYSRSYETAGWAAEAPDHNYQR